MPRARIGNRRYKYEPDYAVAPGQTLQETIDALGIDQRELAARTGLSAKHINQVIKGVASITQDTAIRLERVTGVPARMWNNLEANYREQLARIAEKERLQDGLQWLKSIPTRELVHRRVIKEHSGRVERLEAVLCFFGVATVDAWRRIWLAPQHSLRKSPAFEAKPGAMATWLRLGELAAQAVECQPFDKSTFREALTQIRTLTAEPPRTFVPEMKQLCANAGVATVLIPEIKGAPASGATRWLTSHKAMMQLSLRYKTDDQFWFSFFHEAGHVLYDGKKETFVDDGRGNDEREARANRFAANHLIPTDYRCELPQLRTWAAVESFAKGIGIAPGIVVGRLQREDILRHNQLNGLKRRFEWVLD